MYLITCKGIRGGPDEKVGGGINLNNVPLGGKEKKRRSGSRAAINTRVSNVNTIISRGGGGGYIRRFIKVTRTCPRSACALYVRRNYICMLNGRLRARDCRPCTRLRTRKGGPISFYTTHSG